MSTTSYVVTAIIIFIGVGVLLDRFKRAGGSVKPSGSQQSKPSPTPNNGPQQNIPLSADESGPTQTGRFRVQQMLSKTEQKKTAAIETSDADDLSEDDEALPDPFEQE